MCICIYSNVNIIIVSKYMCMHMCMYIYIYTCIYVCIYVCVLIIYINCCQFMSSDDAITIAVVMVVVSSDGCKHNVLYSRRSHIFTTPNIMFI